MEEPLTLLWCLLSPSKLTIDQQVFNKYYPALFFFSLALSSFNFFCCIILSTFLAKRHGTW